jgi:enterobactin synthetase component D
VAATTELPFSEGELFGPGVAHVSMRFTIPDVPSPRPFGIEVPASMQHAVPKRRQEFAAGRWCVREALRRLDPALEHVEVGIGSHREPLFPDGVVGAISHGGGIASAAVAWQRDALGVGIDLEAWIAADALASVLDAVLVEGEATRLLQQTGWSLARVATLVFSAKETLYKCLFPSVRRYFDFKDAELCSIEPSTGRFTARLRVSLTDDLRDGERFEGRMQIADEGVITTMVRRPRP